VPVLVLPGFPKGSPKNPEQASQVHQARVLPRDPEQEQALLEVPVLVRVRVRAEALARAWLVALVLVWLPAREPVSLVAAQALAWPGVPVRAWLLRAGRERQVPALERLG